MEKDNFKQHKGLFKEEGPSMTTKEFNKNTDYPPKVDSDIGHFELKDRIALYQSRSTMSMEASFELQKIEKSYGEAQQKMIQDHTVAGIHYSDGVQSGLPQTPYGEIQKVQEHQASVLRKQTLIEAKQVYRQHSGLSKEFEPGKEG